MSYILDALNKSEKERARQRLPGLGDLHEEAPARGLTLRHFLVALAVLLLVNLAIVYVYFGDRLAAPDVMHQEIPGEEQSRVTYATQPTPRISAPPAISAPVPADTAASTGSQPVPPGPVLDISDLPAAVQARLPSIEVTAHIYADDAEFRVVKIDGIQRAEGDVIGDSHRLIEITETGLVLGFENYRYRLDIVEDWQLR